MIEKKMSKIGNTRPMEDGYRMPGEFEPHQGCWMIIQWREPAGVYSEIDDP